MSSWTDKFKKGFAKDSKGPKRRDSKEQEAYSEYLKNAPKDETKKARKKALGNIIRYKK